MLKQRKVVDTLALGFRSALLQGVNIEIKLKQLRFCSLKGRPLIFAGGESASVT